MNLIEAFAYEAYTEPTLERRLEWAERRIRRQCSTPDGALEYVRDWHDVETLESIYAKLVQVVASADRLDYAEGEKEVGRAVIDVVCQDWRRAALVKVEQ